MAFDLAVRVHLLSLELPSFEKYETGNQVRRSSKSIYAQIAEGYGRKAYKQDFVKYVTYAQASGDETISHIMIIVKLYPDQPSWQQLLEEYQTLGKRINKYIQYVEKEWKT